MPARKVGDAPPRRRIREVRSSADPRFAEAYALLKRTFSRSELIPRREWNAIMRELEADLYSDINWHLLVALRGDRLIGAASGSYLGNLNIGVVSYIAVDAKAREDGLGPLLRRRLGALFKMDAQRIRGRALRAIVGEIEADNPWLRSLVRRHRAIPLDFPYEQPSLGGKRKPVALVLYWQPTAGREVTWLGAAHLRRVLYTLWRRTFRVDLPLREPSFRRIMASLEGRKRIGARELPPATD